MKRFAISCFLCIICSLGFSQTTEKYYYPAYITNKHDVTKLATEQQLHKKSVSFEVITWKYPVLETLDNFIPHYRYSIINAEVVIKIIEKKRYQVFVLTNGTVYKVKKSKRVSESYKF